MEEPNRTPKFLVAYALWFLASAAGGAVWVHNAAGRRREALRAEVILDANHAATRLAFARQELHGFMKALARTQDVEALFKDPSLRRLKAQAGPLPGASLSAVPAVAALSGRLEKMTTDLEAQLIFVVEASRARCLSSSDWRTDHSTLGDVYPDRRYVQESLAGRIGEAYLVGRHSGVLGSYFAVPVRPQDEVLGSLVLQISAQTWGTRLGLGRNPVLVCDRDGVVLCSNRKEWNLTLLPGCPGLPPGPCLAAFGKPRLDPLPLTLRKDHEYQDAAGQQWLEVEVPVADSSLRVHLLTPMAHLAAITRALWMQAAVLVLLGWVLLWVIEQVWFRMTALHRLSSHDPLTQTLNRRGFDLQGGQEWTRAVRFNRPLAILAMDLDHFKTINDRFGHAAGDHVLRSVINLCRTQLRDMDLMARTGGEEFVILLSETGLERAKLVGERIRVAVQNLMAVWAANPIQVTVSIGLAERTPADKALAEVLQRADQALYQAKTSGRNRVEAYFTE